MSDIGSLRARIEERRARAHLLRTGVPLATRRWRPRRGWESAARAAAYIIALGCTIAGAALAVSEPSTSVSMTAATYRIGATTLHANGSGVYLGDAALVVSRSDVGIVRSAADTSNGGRAESGVCFLSASERQERCVFDLGTTSMSAVDTWNGSGWSRRYDDGQQVTIPSDTMAPVPFAVGR
ncbi:MAG: hypothetical protein JF886_14210 [Candidatus Dormibacteraeota bacterium]|uniref:Uncharacterized protein n=1 Tax=Candidatus Aeolococcus gillhamiae TaxID=3127015 RepID=A0A934K2A3_9BACT|nr:hypothetical protein [Candidatus Dormibacteraeota bacterium]